VQSVGLVKFSQLLRNNGPGNELDKLCLVLQSFVGFDSHGANHKSLYEDSTVTSARREKFKFYCHFVFNEKTVPNPIEWDFNNLLYHLFV
jgi:hypothetical protein